MNARSKKRSRLARAAVVVALALCLLKTAPGGYRPVMGLVRAHPVAAAVR